MELIELIERIKEKILLNSDDIYTDIHSLFTTMVTNNVSLNNGLDINKKMMSILNAMEVDNYMKIFDELCDLSEVLIEQ